MQGEAENVPGQKLQFCIKKNLLFYYAIFRNFLTKVKNQMK